jgi:predicted metal-dependent phosphoesterase TrpH
LRIDLHVHASERSPCSHATEEEMIAAAQAFGLDALCFSDHDRLVDEAHLRELRERHAPFRVFNASEISITPADHCLVIGVEDPELVSRAWEYPELHAFVRERAGFIAACHPFRFERATPLPLDEFPPDAFELRSVHTAAEDEPLIRETAARLGSHLVCNSDAHYAEWVGVFFNVLPGEPADELELAEILRSGELECATDSPRAAQLPGAARRASVW